MLEPGVVFDWDSNVGRVKVHRVNLVEGDLWRQDLHHWQEIQHETIAGHLPLVHLKNKFIRLFESHHPERQTFSYLDD